MTDTPNEATELDLLKERAEVMNISYHPSIGLDKLREKVNSAITSETVNTSTESVEEKGTLNKPKTRTELLAQAKKLVRVNVTCMNPNMKEHEGGLYSVGNGIVGMFKVFVPFNVDWHVPQIVLTHMQNRKCQIFSTNKSSKGSSVPKLIKELSIDILDPLTPEELKALGQRQIAQNSLDQ
jgi:hypothetical protein